ncbi:MAG: ABC transporter ATP-binding protein [Actinobacteria bacterium]|nr:ABC transporter ATP-binding protein [Actinomycetota bacterium]
MDPTMLAADSVHSARMSRIEIRDLSKSFGDLAVLHQISLEIESGSFVSFIGPSGCGKTTLVRVIAGLQAATAGEVRVDGDSPEEARAHKRVAMVPQQPGLLPWRTVRANARLLLDINRAANPPDAAEPEALLREVGLGDFMDAYPHELSGGMLQRVSLVRALALNAPLLVMDEPFAALDEITRAEMRALLNGLVAGRGVTVLFVTHSIPEAVALSDRVIVSSPRPTTIVADLIVDLPRPRARDIDDEARFVDLCAQVRHALHGAMRP